MSAEKIKTEEKSLNFLEEIVENELESGKYTSIVTRFPPEPNGYLHIGHAKSICLNFGLALKYGGKTNLRFDDTNPVKEDIEYVDSIKEDVKWLGFEWANELYASDYFETLYEYAVKLINKGLAYVDDSTPEEIAVQKGTPTEPGKGNEYRNRNVEENLTLFAGMRAGEFKDGEKVLRAKIDLASPNMHMRDPLMYRIKQADHHRTGNAWCIYPMYDFAHCLSDYIEGITHSICTLEFEVHRPLYDWILKQLELPRPVPRQHEFARFSLSYTVMSKRKLMQLVNDGFVSGWDDPRMPTISGLRRRGVTPSAVRRFAYNIGITKYKGVTQVETLEHAIRQELNEIALRKFVVLRPVKVVITNYSEEKTEEFEALNNAEDPSAGTRKIPFTRVLYIEREDFMETPPPNYFRLRPGGEVRLKYAYIIRCDEVIKDSDGAIAELRCTADLQSKTGGATATRKMRVALHWVSAAHAIEAEIRLYERLFTVSEPDATGDFKSTLNPQSSEFLTARCEPSLSRADSELRYQFERLGYFALDWDSAAERLVFNRVIALKDRWANFNAKAGSHAQHQSAPTPVAEEHPLKRSGLNWQSAESAAPLMSEDAQWERNAVKSQVSGENGHGSASADIFINPTASDRDGAPGKAAIRRGLSISGRLVRTARLREEYYADFGDPEATIQALKRMPGRVDLLTFIQRPPDAQPRYDFHFEWEGIAALPLTSFDQWWKHQIPKETRRKVERAENAGVVIRHVPLDDDLVRGITKIYNEAPVKRGKPNRHYGKNFAQVKAGMERDLRRSGFIGAYYEEELIGVIKVVYAGSLASPVTNLAMFAHRDKMTNYALMAELVRSCLKKKTAFVFYGIWKTRREGMREFLESNGFKQVDVPRFYVPLTTRGAMYLRLGLHKGLMSVLPDNLVVKLIALRSRWYAMSYARRSGSPPIGDC